MRSIVASSKGRRINDLKCYELTVGPIHVSQTMDVSQTIDASQTSDVYQASEYQASDAFHVVNVALKLAAFGLCPAGARNSPLGATCSSPVVVMSEFVD